MALPPPVHLGSGEVSASFRPASTPPNLVNPDAVAHYLATGDTTKGGFGVFRWDIGSGEMTAARHFHRTFSESFFVVSGTVSLYDGRHWFEADPGDFMYVPTGGVHAFHSDLGAQVSLLIIFSPGVPREKYFEGLADLAEGRWNPSPDQLADFYSEHDTFPVPT